MKIQPERILLFSLLIAVVCENILLITIPSRNINLRPDQILLPLLLLTLLIYGRVRLYLVVLLLLAHILSAVPGLINSVSLSSSLKALALELFMVGLAIAVFLSVDTKAKLLAVTVFWALVVGNLVNLYGLLQFGTWAIGRPIAPMFFPELYPLYRVYSTFFEPNFYGNFLVCQIVLLIMMWLAPTFARYRLWAILSLGPALILLVLNQSRGAWLGLIFALTVFVTFNYLVHARISQRLVALSVLAVSGGVIVGVLAFALLPPVREALIQRVADTLNPLREQAASDRYVDIQQAAAAFGEHPLIGNGLGSWGSRMQRLERDRLTPPRNVFVAWLYAKGLLGAAVGLLLIGVIIHRTVRALRTPDPDYHILVWMYFTCWIMIFFTFQFSMLEGLTRFYWVVVGLVFASTRLALASQVAPVPQEAPGEAPGPSLAGAQA